MAITPRTIFRNPILLLLATLALGAGALAVTAACFTGSCSRSNVEVYTAPVVSEFGACTYVASQPDAQHQWTENDYIAVAACFDGMKDSSSAIRTANVGLVSFPHSEALYNIKGYHQIEMKDYEGAVTTLRHALKVVRTTSGTLQNNLAWAGLWVPRKMTLGEARDLYTHSLRRDSESCEAVHTGLWVEYAIAAQANGPTRGFAIKRYDNLRDRYDGCERRLSASPSANLISEVLGTGVLDYEMAMLSSSDSKPDWARRHAGNSLIRMATTQAISAQVDRGESLCEAATPIGALQHTCIQLTKKARR